jgi:histidinol-phosphate aminotransferase
MTDADLRHLARSSLRDAQPYDPGITASDVQARYELSEVVKLNWNEDLFGLLPGVREAVIEGLDRIAVYPDQAYTELRLALSAWTRVPARNIVPAHGIQSLVMTVVAALFEPGACTVIPTPTYGLYAAACLAVGVDVVRVPCRELRLDVSALLAAAHDRKARVIWVCDPNNPTGAAMSAEEWRALLDELPSDCAVVADEAYVEYMAPLRRLTRERDAVDGAPVIVLRTFSKLFGLAGLRLGYAVAHRSLVPCIDAVQEPFNVNRAALAAGLACLRDPDRVERRRLEVVAARERLSAGLQSIGMRPLPSEANFVLVDAGGDDLGFSEALQRDGILVRAGSEFGLPGHLRITVGPPALMDRVVACLAAAREEIQR